MIVLANLFGRFACPPRRLGLPLLQRMSFIRASLKLGSCWMLAASGILEAQYADEYSVLQSQQNSSQQTLHHQVTGLRQQLAHDPFGAKGRASPLGLAA